MGRCWPMRYSTHRVRHRSRRRRALGDRARVARASQAAPRAEGQGRVVAATDPRPLCTNAFTCLR